MADIDENVEKLSPLGFEGLSTVQLTHLNKPFSAGDVEVSVRSMGRLKAPGPDGFQPVFYQECWEVVGDSVIRFVLDFFRTNSLPRGMNDALVVLIAKVLKPETIMQFRPISLCNVLYKIITKTMVLRLKPLMTTLIGRAQSSFIPGRLSTDNIIIVQEAVHSMRRKKGRKGWMMLKLDLEKAYDRIRWDFLEDTLRAAHLPEHWRNWIMSCVAGFSMTLLWNGEKTTLFTPARGLRQGDPLSPYLFVLCLERLCHLIERHIALKKWKPVRLSRGGPELSHVCFADDLIVFAEASVSQVRVIRRVLEQFCVASGQKVNLEKSKIFFSDNVSRELAKSITDESGIKQTRILGKYLGMPVLHKRINKDTFGEVIERVASRISGWRGRSLSLAGRVTLTKSVLSSIPIYSMSTIALPQSTVEELEKISRAFLWESSVEKKKPHLIAWDQCCSSKSDGGLGIRSVKQMNKAMLAKLGWRLIKDTTSLWSQVLRSKYKIGDIRNDAWLVVKSSWSPTWRSIGIGLREGVIPGLRWVLGNGSYVRFWYDRWLLDTSLSEVVITPLPAAFRFISVRDLWLDNGGWNLPYITPYVSHEVILRLSSLMVDVCSGKQDRLSWGGCSDGKFSVRSAYSLFTRDLTLRPQMGHYYAKVWNTIVLERVRLFMWLTSHSVLLTNAERHRRHLSTSSICQVCKGGDETILHILRDCPAMFGIWDRLLPVSKRGTFFTQPLLVWLYENLGDDQVIRNCPWAILFATGIWWGWKWRCGNIFGNNRKCRDRVKFVVDLALEYSYSHSRLRGGSHSGPRVERMIAWIPPRCRWLRLNTDGASHGNPGAATSGGVLQNGYGTWCHGFALNIGVCTAPLTELWGVYCGLGIAWEYGATRVELEVDSEIVVGFLKTGIEDSHPLSPLVHLCYGLLSKDWEVQISHVYREANRLADGLANYAFTLPLDLHRFTHCPESLDSVVIDDIRDSAQPRMVKL